MAQANDNIANGKNYTVESVDPNLIPSNKQGKPQILWVGCSSSWITETDALNVERPEIFVHRNLGNVLSYADLSSESAIEYALDHLNVDHIVICGHYDCRLQKNEFMEGIHAINREPNGESAAKSFPIKMKTEKRSPESEREEEYHVLREVKWVKQQPHVAKAIQERGLQVHGLIYDKEINKCSKLVEA